MEQKPIACGNRLPPLSSNYPWLVAQNLDGTGYQTFYTINNQLCCRYQCRIPKLLGRRIRGYSHGWVILSKNNDWSVWNPMTSKVINLPPLILGSSESVGQCCLSFPPGDPNSVLLLLITQQPTFVFCRLGSKRERLRWTRMPYTRMLKDVIDSYGIDIECLTSYNGKVYATCCSGEFVIQIDTIVKDGDVSIKLILLGRCPLHYCYGFPTRISLLKGSCTDLFYVKVVFNEVTKETLGNVYLFKWVMASMSWEEVVAIEDAVFYIDLSHDYSIYYNQAIASKMGGYIHIRDEMGKMYSYDVEDKTISVSSMDYPTSHVSLWECRFQGDLNVDSELTLDLEKEDKDDKIVVRSVVTDDEVGSNESRLLNLPFHLLEMIMDHCIGVEYMCFRSTCKQCHLAAPLIQWNNKTRLRKYSLVSPWLMVVDKNRGRITFTDPVFGDKYFMKRSHVSIRRDRIRCSRFGWLLLCSEASTLVFFNPFTSVIRELPYVNASDGFDSLCFSAPPTSRDCMVVGFRARGKDANVYIHSEQRWRMIGLDFRGATPPRFCFPTFCGRDVYALCDKGEIYVFKNVFKSQDFRFKKVAVSRKQGGECFLVKGDQHFLLVVLGDFGEDVEVLKLNCRNKEWEKVESIGRYMIYIDGATCLCIEAKAPELENKIFFPRLHSKNGKIVFYSLETGNYHTFNGKDIQQNDGVGIKHVNSHSWIQPTWS